MASHSFRLPGSVGLSLFGLILAGPAGAHGAEAARKIEDNAELRVIYQQDQADRDPRKTGKAAPSDADWKAIAQRDTDRRARALQLLHEGQIRTAQDFFHAALLLQHSGTVEDTRLAYSLANISVVLEPDKKPDSIVSRWLSAASWDRLMMLQGRPQWYGTQYAKSAQSGKMELYKIDESAVTDKERMRHGLRPLAEIPKTGEELEALMKEELKKK